MKRSQVGLRCDGYDSVLFFFFFFKKSSLLEFTEMKSEGVIGEISG